MESRYNEAKQILEKYNQQHLLNFYEKLSENQKEELLEQVLAIDYELINKLYERTKKAVEFKNNKIEPISYIDKSKLSQEELNEYQQIGEELIKQGKLAVVTMAGGQGTRLGHLGPKGTYILDEENNKSLFEILCENLKQAKAKYNVTVSWYLMTSRENNKDTMDFFEKNNYFNYPKEAIKFFIQGELPMIDESGKILIDETGLIKQAADGHGGIFEAMYKNNVLEDMAKKGVEWVFINGVDNPLAKLVDPIFIGVTVKRNTLAAGKSLVKANPSEKVGVFCKKDGKPSVVEYTEISKEMSEMTDQNGELVYGEAHIIMNMFNRKALEQIGKNKLEYHSAHKKATYINEAGDIVKPESPNAYKFESFIFDAFERLDDMSILRVKREEEFAPVKNAEGVDSPETARALYKNYINRIV